MKKEPGYLDSTFARHKLFVRTHFCKLMTCLYILMLLKFDFFFIMKQDFTLGLPRGGITGEPPHLASLVVWLIKYKLR